MTTETTTQGNGTDGRTRSALLLSLLLGAALAALVALAGMAREAHATFPGTNGKLVFISQRTTGTGVDNPTGDSEIFSINPDGTGLRQLTNNTKDDREPVLSPDGKKVAYESQGDPTSSPGGDQEIYLMNASDGSDKKNLSNNLSAGEFAPVFSSDGTKIAYASSGVQTSNSQDDSEVYTMSALDGSGKKNLTNNGAGVSESYPLFSPNGKKVAYTSQGKQVSNPEGDYEVYRMNTLDGSGKRNLTNDAGYDYNPDWGVQAM